MTDGIETTAHRWHDEDKKIVDAAIKRVLDIYQTPPTSTYNRIPLRELVGYVLQDEKVPGQRLPRIKEEVITFFEKLSKATAPGDKEDDRERPRGKE